VRRELAPCPWIICYRCPRLHTASRDRAAGGVEAQRYREAAERLKRRGGERALRVVASEELDPRNVSARGSEGRIACHEGSP
jgi:hypothetical protein